MIKQKGGKITRASPLEELLPGDYIEVVIILPKSDFSKNRIHVVVLIDFRVVS